MFIITVQYFVVIFHQIMLLNIYFKIMLLNLYFKILNVFNAFLKIYLLKTPERMGFITLKIKYRKLLSITA